MNFFRWVQDLSERMSRKEVSDTLDLLRLQLKGDCRISEIMAGLHRHG